MDAISALGVAGNILTVTELSAELLSASDASKVSSSLEEKDETSVLENFRKLRPGLSKKRASLQQRFPASPSPPLKHELALLELASSFLEDSGMLLEDIGFRSGLALEAAPSGSQANPGPGNIHEIHSEALPDKGPTYAQGGLSRHARRSGAFLLDRGHADPEIVAGIAAVPAV